MATNSRRKIFLAFFIFTVAIVTKIIPSLSENLTADACIYLDIGRNVFSGKGLSLSYNLYQYWAGSHYYPAMPLFPPLFPLLVGMVWKLFHSLQAAILLNVFIAGSNSVVFYYILFLGVGLFILLYRGLNRSSLTDCLNLSLGLFMVILPYELFCIFRYNLFYPAYLKVNSIGYMKAIILGGYYDILKIPVVRSYPQPWPETMALLTNIPIVLGLFAFELVKNINFLICFLIYRIHAIFRRTHPKEQLLFIIGITSLIVSTLLLSYQPRFNYIDIIRFSLVPFIFLVPLSIAGFFDFRAFLERRFPRHYQKLYWIGIFIVAFSMGKFAVTVNKDYNYERRQYNNSREEFFGWIKGIAGEDQLVAVAGNLIQEAFSLQRPIVSVPTGAFLNPHNMRKFLSLYRPHLIIMERDAVARYRPYIADFTHELGAGEGWHSLYSAFQIDYSK